MRFVRQLVAAAAVVGVATGLVVVPASADPVLDALATPSVRSPIAGESFYFVMTDRYLDGDPSNNAGGRTGPASVTGFEPSSDAFYHGGDLAGLTGRCDPTDPEDDGLARLKRLGFTAVWITPPFVQRTVQSSSAAYHGYWFLDITRPDPHVGTEKQFEAFTDCARRLGIKVFLDVVVNHTADAIGYRQDNDYVSLRKAPYRTATGRVFNPWRFTSGASFPALSRTRSFAKTPFVLPGLAGAKAPAILNDVTRYHNRGDIDWASCVGRCEMDGDFVGLDDLMTEDWAVVRALAEAYGSWITRYGVDGFRLDTAKHVDPSFFGRWLPLINESAQATGRPDFTVFGEAWLEDTGQLSELMIERQLPSVLDFPFQDTVWQFAAGRTTGRSVAGLFADDDYYTTASTNAYGLTTFLGNHDMGRIGFFLASIAGLEGAELLERDLFAHDVLYLTRGVPVVYYGDEVGMTGSGDGRDKNARQDMASTQVPQWRVENRVGGTPIGTGSSFDESSVIEARLRQLAALRTAHPALASGAQLTRLGDGSVFAASRVDATTRTEYVVAFNAGDAPATVVVPTSTPSTAWAALLGSAAAVSDGDGRVQVTISPRSTLVLRAGGPLPVPAPPTITLRTSQDLLTGRHLLAARVPGADPSSVTFVMRAAGATEWTVLGSDDARPFRVYVPPRRGAPVQVAAVVADTAGQRASTVPATVSLAPFP